MAPLSEAKLDAGGGGGWEASRVGSTRSVENKREGEREDVWKEATRLEPIHMFTGDARRADGYLSG